MNVSITIFTALLFVALTPGVLFYFPKKGSKMTVALFHGVIFALVYQLTYKTILRFTGHESFTRKPAATPQEIAQFEAQGKVNDMAYRLGVINLSMTAAESQAAINKSLMPGGAMYKEKHKNERGGGLFGGGLPAKPAQAKKN